jgi:hypothetical protein
MRHGTPTKRAYFYVKILDGTDEKTVLRWFITKNGTLAITGTDFEEHELWMLHEDTAFLVGTLIKSKFNHVLKLRKGSVLELDSDSFDWINHRWESQTFNGRGCSAYENHLPRAQFNYAD